MSVGNRLSVVDVAAGEGHDRSRANDRILGVCHIASGDRWAGAEAQLSALLKGLQQIPDLRICVILLNEGRLAAEVRQIGIDVCVLDEAKQGFFQIFLDACRYLSARSIQALHSHRYKENLLDKLLAGCSHVPIHVSSFHGAPEPFHGWRRFKQCAIQLLDRHVSLYAADRIISVSEELRTELIRGISPNKVVTIYNGIDEKAVSSHFTAVEAKKRLGLSSDCAVVGTVGRLDPIKRLDIFLNAARQIDSNFPNARFVIAGEGTEASKLRDLATSLGVSDRVLFLGHRDDIYDVIRALDILVFCSDHEGLPMALLEALYLGVPVITRPVGGIPEVIQDGVTGIWLSSPEPEDLAKACLDILVDQPRRKALAEEGCALVAGAFTAFHAAQRTAALYRALTNLR